MRTGFDDALFDLLWLRPIPQEKRAMIRGALMAAKADRMRRPNVKARIIADAFHVEYAAVRALVAW